MRRKATAPELAYGLGWAQDIQDPLASVVARKDGIQATRRRVAARQRIAEDQILLNVVPGVQSSFRKAKAVWRDRYPVVPLTWKVLRVDRERQTESVVAEAILDSHAGVRAAKGRVVDRGHA